jgi:hypothetical protein
VFGLSDVLELPTVFGRCRDRRATFRAAPQKYFICSYGYTL